MGQKAWRQLAGRLHRHRSWGLGKCQEATGYTAAEGREGDGCLAKSQELSSSGWKQITGVSIGSGSSQEGKVRPAWGVSVGAGGSCSPCQRLKFKRFLRMTQIPETQISRFDDILKMEINTVKTNAKVLSYMKTFYKLIRKRKT